MQLPENNLEEKKKYYNPATTFKNSSIIAVGVIIGLVILNQTFNYYFLQQYINESNIISIAGRQRVLCQRIAKDIMIVSNQQQQQMDSSTIAKKYKKDLIQNIQAWEKGHYALQTGDDELGVPEHHHSEKLKNLFHELNGHFDNMYHLTRNFVEHKFSKEISQKNIDEILKYEGLFLDTMDKIVKQYGKEMADKLFFLKNLQFFMFGITLLIVILEGLFVFKPMVKKIEKYFFKNNAIQTALEKSNAEMLISKEELEQNNEELTLINENLKQAKADASNALKELSDNLVYAHYIQQAFLPNKDHVISQFGGGFIFDRPKDIVSGDFYWYSKINNTKIICVGDCTGHGVSGSLMTMVCMALLNEIVNEKKIISPSDILIEMDKRITETLQGQHDEENRINDGMDGVIVAVDEKNRSLIFAGAKSSIYVVKKGEILEIKGSNYPVGNLQYGRTKNYTEEYIELNTNDWIFMSSDGFKDQFNPKTKKKYLNKNFKILLQRIAGLSLGMQYGAVDTELKQWQKDTSQTDDILVLGLKV